MRDVIYGRSRILHIAQTCHHRPRFPEIYDVTNRHSDSLFQFGNNGIFKWRFLSDMAKLRPAKDFLRPLKQNLMMILVINRLKLRFFGLIWEKNILKKFCCGPQCYLCFENWPANKKSLATPDLYDKNYLLISNFHRFHLIRRHSGLCRIQFGNNKYFGGFNFNGVIRNSILVSVDKVWKLNYRIY